MTNLSNAVLPNVVHPDWCRRGPDCASGLHFSGKSCLARGDEVIQVSAGLWLMDVEGGLSAGGVLLECSADDEDYQQWFIDTAQSYALARFIQRLLSRAHPALPRVA